MGMYADIPNGSCFSDQLYKDLIESMSGADNTDSTDPVLAFSLAAGVLQVVDVSFRALSACREIHKDASLA